MIRIPSEGLTEKCARRDRPEVRPGNTVHRCERALQYGLEYMRSVNLSLTVPR